MAEVQDEFGQMVARVRRGDQQALLRLVQLYEPEIRRTAHFRLGPALRPFLDTMDLVQSVHRSLLNSIQQNKLDVSSPDHLVGLAVIMVHRKIARQWRRPSASRPVHMSSLPLEEKLVSLSSSAADPARVAEVRDQIRHILEQLNDKERRLLELRLQNYNTTEAARELGLDAACLRVYLQRLRKRFREASILPECL